MVQPAGQYAQGAGLNTGTMQFWPAGKLAMDIYHGYLSWIKQDIAGYNLDNIVGYVERYME